MLTLKRFCVTQFRSVQDSGWIATDAITALIGTNESGKTNLLVPLWKLNPAKDGEIDYIADFPRAQYNAMRDKVGEVTFIRAEFVPDETLRTKLASLTGTPAERFEIVDVARRFDGKYVVRFPTAQPPTSIAKADVLQALSRTAEGLASDKALKKDEALKAAMTSAVTEATKRLEQLPEDVDEDGIESITEALAVVNLGDPGTTSTMAARWRELTTILDELAAPLNQKRPEEVKEAVQIVIKSLPSFVYYSNYGNLDSEIYLPHVIENLKRTNLGAKEAAKARTLKVLFEYVKLKPEEILELGEAAQPAEGANGLTSDEIKAAQLRTKERSILLRSADTELSKAFREWWKQGEYRFRFDADGDHFRIWVSDDKRPEDIELESRSTGLQWFFSFFLVFLVEHGESQKGSILLLDEPGLSLHPLSQRDLSSFFATLSKTNPLIYTTHSPFLVAADHLDRVRLVYVNKAGATAVSSDLRSTTPPTTQVAEAKSVYAVHAALGLSVSLMLFQGCTNVIVEGPSDQFYLTAIKSILIARKQVAPKRELLFVPAGGAKGVNAIVPIVTAKDEAVPIVIFDDDQQGRKFAEALRDGPFYKGAADRIVNVRTLVNFDAAEVEDLIPQDVLANVASRMGIRGSSEDFDDVVKAGQPVVPQLEAYAAANKIALEPGWKVELARQTKQRMLKDADRIPDSVLASWTALFAHFEK